MLYFSDFDTPLVILDIGWFCDVLNDLQNMSRNPELQRPTEFLNLHPELAIFLPKVLLERWQTMSLDEKVCHYFSL